MKKGKKFFKLSMFGIGFFALFVTISASAATVTINHAVPTMQGYVTLSSKSKSQASSYGTVTLTKKDPVAVTFSARAKKTDGSWGAYQAGTVVEKTNTKYNVAYEYNLGAGTTVQARFRNHNWALNSNQIEGTFDYK